VLLCGDVALKVGGNHRGATDGTITGCPAAVQEPRPPGHDGIADARAALSRWVNRVLRTTIAVSSIWTAPKRRRLSRSGAAR